MLSPERDEQLAQMTEHRVTTFAHDLCPDYLRTKLEPMAESKMMQLETKALGLQYDNAQVWNILFLLIPYYMIVLFQKQIATYQKVISHVWDIVSKAREEWETESSSRGNTQQNSSVADTHLLVAAVGMGKGLKVINYIFSE